MEVQYLAISKHGFYAAIPSEHDIRICMATEGYLCMLNQAPYPIENLEWCVYALYFSDRDRINKQCLVYSNIWYSNLLVNLDVYLWAVGSLVIEKIQSRYLTETHIELITPPLTIIYNGCEGYSRNIFIPAKS